MAQRLVSAGLLDATIRLRRVRSHRDLRRLVTASRCLLTGGYRNCESRLESMTMESATSPKFNSGWDNPGLKLRAELDRGKYPTGIKINDAELASLNLKCDSFHGDWNYVVLPTRKKT